MYGVPEDLDLAFLHNGVLTQVCLGQFQVQFHFSPVGSIYAESAWELLDSTGRIIDQNHDGPDRPPYQLHQLLGQHVTGSEVSAPDFFALYFERGQVLRVYDDSREYESFSIQPGNIFV
jgi:hypothetical protein